MWTFFNKCMTEVFIEPQFEDIIVDLHTLEFVSKGRKLSYDHNQVSIILYQWFIFDEAYKSSQGDKHDHSSGMIYRPKQSLYLAISRLTGVRGPPYQPETTLNFVKTVTFHWSEGRWSPFIYTVIE